jgi:hypothetical protein
MSHLKFEWLPRSFFGYTRNEVSQVPTRVYWYTQKKIYNKNKIDTKF